jgi:RNA polymerase sigma-70 factor (ECF subfamily)
MIMPIIKRFQTRIVDSTIHPDLLARCLQGDEEAWETMVLSCAGRIYAMCYHYARRRDRAEDLTQEIFIRIYQNLGTFQPDRGSFTSWTLSLGRNLIIDRFRQERRRRYFEDRAQLEALQIQDRTLPGPQKRMEQVETRRMLGEALGALPPETKEAIILKDLRGMAYSEIAEAQGVAEGTVKSRLYRGRLALARSLARRPALREMQHSPLTA